MASTAMVYGPQLSDIEAAQNAREGSKRLLISICQHHAKHHSRKDAREYWARKGLRTSFEVVA